MHPRPLLTQQLFGDQILFYFPESWWGKVEMQFPVSLWLLNMLPGNLANIFLRMSCLPVTTSVPPGGPGKPAPGQDTDPFWSSALLCGFRDNLGNFYILSKIKKKKGFFFIGIVKFNSSGLYILFSKDIQIPIYLVLYPFDHFIFVDSK